MNSLCGDTKCQKLYKCVGFNTSCLHGLWMLENLVYFFWLSPTNCKGSCISVQSNIMQIFQIHLQSLEVCNWHPSNLQLTFMANSCQLTTLFWLCVIIKVAYWPLVNSEIRWINNNIFLIYIPVNNSSKWKALRLLPKTTSSNNGDGWIK